MASTTDALPPIFRKLLSEVGCRTLPLRFVWNNYPDGDPRKAKLGELITDLEAEPLEALEFQRLAQVAELLREQEPTDRLVLELLRELSAFTTLAEHLRSLDTERRHA